MNSMLSRETSKFNLYASAGVSAFSAYKHTAVAFSDLFAKYDHSFIFEPLVAYSAKSNFLQVAAGWALIGILQLRWARYGLASTYDKAIWAGTARIHLPLAWGNL